MFNPPSRGDPFQPAKSYYHERMTLQTAGSTVNCHKCIRRGNPFNFEPEHQIEKVKANSQFSRRLDTHIIDFNKRTGHGTITDGFFSAHEGRFETNPTSSFCGGEIQRYSLIRPGTTDDSQRNSTSRGRWTFTTNDYFDVTSVKRPLVAHQANTPSIRLGNYAKRKPDDYFYLPGKAPRATETAGHGGLYYSCDNYDKIVYSASVSNTVPFAKEKNR